MDGWGDTRSSDGMGWDRMGVGLETGGAAAAGCCWLLLAAAAASAATATSLMLAAGEPLEESRRSLEPADSRMGANAKCTGALRALAAAKSV
ncbi:hypothetical protein PG995_002895 [Apiospora arundinis]